MVERTAHTPTFRQLQVARSASTGEAVAASREANRQIDRVRNLADTHARERGTAAAERRLADEQRRLDVGLSTTFLVTQAQRDLLQAQVNLLQTTLDHQSAIVNFKAVQQAPPPGSVVTIGVRGSDIVLGPVATPRGIFRAGAGQ